MADAVLDRVQHRSSEYVIGVGWNWKKDPTPATVFGIEVVNTNWQWAETTILRSTKAAIELHDGEFYRLDRKAGKTSLWREFAKIPALELHDTAKFGKGVCLFAKSYGLLTEGTSDSRYYSLTPEPKPDAASYRGESVELWRQALQEIQALKSLLEEVSPKSARQEESNKLEHLLRKQETVLPRIYDFEPETHIKWSVVACPSLSISVKKVAPDADNPSENYISAALEILRRVTNQKLKGNVEYTLIPERYISPNTVLKALHGFPATRLVPKDLLTFIWLSFAEDVSRRPNLVQCKNQMCKELFEPTNRNQDYCTDDGCGQKQRRNPTGRARGRPPKDKSATPVPHPHPESSLP